MLEKTTLNKLRDLKLTAMASKYEWQQEQHEIRSLSFEERLGMLVDAQWLDKHDRRVNSLAKQAGFRYPAAAEDIDYREKRGITKADILRLCGCLYIQKKQNVILTGPTGVGKTYIACALGRCACQHGFAVKYLRTADLFASLDEAHAAGSYPALKKRLGSVPLLILDDWGMKPFSMAEAYEISELAELRYGRASTVVSTQLPHHTWHELFPDPTVAEAILDRLIHNAFKYNLAGESMRKTLALRQFADEEEGAVNNA